MSTFTPITKQRLSWSAPASTNTPTPNVFTTTTKQKLDWQAPGFRTVLTSPSVDFVFSDGIDFLFSDGSDYLFSNDIYGPDTSERTPTTWTQLTKS